MSNLQSLRKKNTSGVVLEFLRTGATLVPVIKKFEFAFLISSSTMVAEKHLFKGNALDIAVIFLIEFLLVIHFLLLSLFS